MLARKFNPRVWLFLETPSVRALKLREDEARYLYFALVHGTLEKLSTHVESIYVLLLNDYMITPSCW